MLVANGANPNLLDGNGESPLTKAISEKSLEMVEFLVENGAKINALDGDGYLPFHDTVTTSGAKMMRYFLQIGASLNLRNVDGNCIKDQEPTCSEDANSQLGFELEMKMSFLQ